MEEKTKDKKKIKDAKKEMRMADRFSRLSLDLRKQGYEYVSIMVDKAQAQFAKEAADFLIFDKRPT